MRNIRKERKNRLIEMIKLFFRRSTNKHKKQHYMMTWLFVWPQKMQKKYKLSTNEYKSHKHEAIWTTKLLKFTLQRMIFVCLCGDLIIFFHSQQNVLNKYVRRKWETKKKNEN